jgi:hypothetical protein
MSLYKSDDPTMAPTEEALSRAVRSLRGISVRLGPTCGRATPLYAYGGIRRAAGEHR